jgi:hypothetical protein
MTQPYLVKSYNYTGITKNDRDTTPFLVKLYEHFQEHSALWRIDNNATERNDLNEED